MTSRDVLASHEYWVIGLWLLVIGSNGANTYIARIIYRGLSMSRPVTLFTGQWADLPLETIAAKAASWGFDGLELACWGDHFEVDKALADDKYVRSRRDI